MNPDQAYNSLSSIELPDAGVVLHFDRASSREAARAAYSLLGPEFPDALARLRELDPMLAGIVARAVLACDRSVLSPRIIDAAITLSDQFPFSAGESLKSYVAASGRIGQIVLQLLAEPLPVLIDYNGSKFSDEVTALALSSLIAAEAGIGLPASQEMLAVLRECATALEHPARAQGSDKRTVPHTVAALARDEFPDLNVIRRTRPQPKSSWLRTEAPPAAESLRRVAGALNEAPINAGVIDRETQSLFGINPRLYIDLQEPLAKARHIAGLAPLFSCR